VLQTGQRDSDSAKMAFIEYVDREGELRPVGAAHVSIQLTHSTDPRKLLCCDARCAVTSVRCSKQRERA
jgi:hypothetical protein